MWAAARPPAPVPTPPAPTPTPATTCDACVQQGNMQWFWWRSTCDVLAGRMAVVRASRGEEYDPITITGKLVQKVWR